MAEMPYSKRTVIGENCSLGQNVNISNNVKIGNRVKIQNNVLVYEGVELEDEVFCGSSCVFTNNLTHRAGHPKGRVYYRKTLVKKGLRLEQMQQLFGVISLENAI